MNDPYAVLGLTQGATTDEVKKAYKRLVMKYHPDRNTDDKLAEEKIKEINVAYEKVKDGPPKSQFKFEDLFQNSNNSWDVFNSSRDFQEFRDHFRKASQLRQHKISIDISLKDAILGGSKNVRFMVNDQVKQFEVTIPRAVSNRETIRFPGLADGADVIITFFVNSDPNWKVEGFNLIQRINIPIWDLILGTELLVPLMNGSTIKVAVPQSTQPNTFLRIKGKGVQHRQMPQIVGDMLVQLNANIPKDIPDELLAVIKKINSE